MIRELEIRELERKKEKGRIKPFGYAQDIILLVKLREFHFSLADFGYKMNWEITSKDYKFKTEEED